jgi:transcriptional regulator with GAF, ATPase, and Fis domain
MAQLLDDAIRALVAPDGRAAGARLLRLLVGCARANAAALLEMRGDQPTLLVGVDVTQETLDAASQAWERSRARLEADESVQRRAHVIAPLRRHGQTLGLLVVDSPRVEGLDDVVRALGPVFVQVLEATRRAEAENPGEELRRLLDENEWNLARVARILGVSRVTIYARLDRYGIPRQRVLKGTA